MEMNFGGDYLSVDSTKDGDVVTIVGKPEPGKLTFKGVEKDIVNIPVENQLKKLIYTPTNKAGKQLVKAWGKDGDKWVGKKFVILHVEDKMHVRPVVENGN